MFFLSCSRLCSVSTREVYTQLRRGPWRTISGHISAKDANVNVFLAAQRCVALPSRRLCHSHVGDLYKNDAVQKYIQQLMEEQQVLQQQLQRAHLNEADRKVMVKRHTQLLPFANIFHSVEKALKELAEVRALLSSVHKDEDEQLVQLLKEEDAIISHRISTLIKELMYTLVPTDPMDPSNVLLEVVSGRTTGGDICQQFTREMFDMYQGFAAYKRWDFEMLNYTPAEYGGLHHAAVLISGENVYRHLKHEGGTHRVQRIPEVGLSSRMQRIHTGTMTVIILPQSVEVDINIGAKELRVDTFRSSGAGGQSVNTTNSAVRIVHIPTGITAECQQTRSQLKNRETALRVLKARLYQRIMGKETEQRHLARKKQVGMRSQSERIRTYNFSQDRITDHRTGYVSRDIKEFMRGGEALDDLITDVLEHMELGALLDLVENGGNNLSRSAD
ncbi:peptide chain release factor 1, mitochondrial isoform X1 [Nerophis ophidion]|uniref:peptide chain release factor 1, mitochondrial isoform X1 n=2 Tax=Nerophis ophidion TaxID=159077 RepID=UPI002ADFF71E|nr:peptide chain release factor 1, mitochondrial isoform X1 [Nerophis ophidion]